MPSHLSLTDIRSRFGLVNQIAPFLAVAPMMEPLRELLRSRPGKACIGIIPQTPYSGPLSTWWQKGSSTTTQGPFLAALTIFVTDYKTLTKIFGDKELNPLTPIYFEAETKRFPGATISGAGLPQTPPTCWPWPAIALECKPRYSVTLAGYPAIFIFSHSHMWDTRH